MIICSGSAHVEHHPEDVVNNDCGGSEWVPESCIMFATADWDEPYWTNKQHCAKALADIGTKVLYVESVGFRSPKAASKKDWGRLVNRLTKGLRSFLFGARECGPNIFVLSPLVIPAAHSRSSLRWLNKILLGHMLRRSARKLGFKNSLIWTYHPFILDVLSQAREALVYHCVDDVAAVPGVDSETYRMAEEELLRYADVVFATAPALAEHCRQYNPNTHYMSNVVDAEHFGRAFDRDELPADLVKIPEPRLGYHGVLSDFKVDFKLLLNAARMRPEWQWVFIGEEREGQSSPLVARLKSLPNVHFLGYRPYAVLPDYLRGIQVGLLPSMRNEYTRSMFPMKYYEYVAAGLPVVSVTLDFARDVAHGPVVFADSVEGYVTAIEKKLVSGKIEAEVVANYIYENTWDRRLEKMLASISALKIRTSKVE